LIVALPPLHLGWPEPQALGPRHLPHAACVPSRGRSRSPARLSWVNRSRSALQGGDVVPALGLPAIVVWAGSGGHHGESRSATLDYIDANTQGGRNIWDCHDIGLEPYLECISWNWTINILII
jgi:hypothetical protein